MLPAPIQPVVQCFVPGLRDVEANKALRKNSLPKRQPADDLVRGKPVSSDLSEQRTEAARRQRKIANDVKCGMCGYVVEDLWACVRTLRISVTCRQTDISMQTCAVCRCSKHSKVASVPEAGGRLS